MTYCRGFERFACLNVKQIASVEKRDVRKIKVSWSLSSVQTVEQRKRVIIFRLGGGRLLISLNKPD